MVIVRRGKKWLLLSRDRKKVLGRHNTREEALEQEQAINISKARKAGHRIPKKK